MDDVRRFAVLSTVVLRQNAKSPEARRRTENLGYVNKGELAEETEY